MAKYTTCQGDMWDSISYKIYGNEKHIDKLIEANEKYRFETIFSAGIIINVPEIDETEAEKISFPSWKTNVK